MIAAVDWDDTLVHVKTQQWLPGAEDAFRALVARFDKVIVHSCRANWPEGHASIEAKVAPFGSNIEIIGKPLADVYIDDRAVRFIGWPSTLRLLPTDTGPEGNVLVFEEMCEPGPRRASNATVDPSAAKILAGWRA